MTRCKSVSDCCFILRFNNTTPYHWRKAQEFKATFYWSNMHRHLRAVTVSLPGRYKVDHVTCIDVESTIRSESTRKDLCRTRSNRIPIPWWQVRGTWCISSPLARDSMVLAPWQRTVVDVYTRARAICPRIRISGYLLITKSRAVGTLYCTEDRTRKSRMVGTAEHDSGLV